MYNPSDARINDVIQCGGKEYLVQKLNPKKIKAVDLKTGKVWNIPYYMANFVRKAGATDLAKFITVADEALHLGQPVVFKTYQKEAGNLFVVIGMTSAGIKIARMFNNTSDSFYRNVQPNSLKVLSHDEVVNGIWQ